MNSGAAYVVVGLGFGDEGKGAIVDHLAAVHPVHTVVRYNGGAQAAHNVVLPDGRHHTFHQFGSGTFRGPRRCCRGSCWSSPCACCSRPLHSGPGGR